MLRIENTAAFLALLAIAARTAASVTISIDRLDPSNEGAQPPTGIVVFDVLVDVSDGDSWISGGFQAHTFNGATFRYAWAPDPNHPTWPEHPLLVNPGTQDRFVTFASKPRPRDGDERFTDG